MMGSLVFVDVVVPHPVGLDQQVSRLHGHGLAIGRGVGAAALDHEPQGGVGVPVGGRGLPGQHDLKAHDDGVALGFEPDVPPKGLRPDAHHVRGLHQRGVDLVPTPEPGLDVVMLALALPVPDKPERGKFLVQFVQPLLMIGCDLGHVGVPLGSGLHARVQTDGTLRQPARPVCRRGPRAGLKPAPTCRRVALRRGLLRPCSQTNLRRVRPRLPPVAGRFRTACATVARWPWPRLGSGPRSPGTAACRVPRSSSPLR